ncbi:hypothetical protein C0Q70_06864 [Pomacea canaliculata]|uniref:Uncharacterized protein n=1 Tax=Pomacea canaliculata TaxID=400727 RepID=A0A2T7PDF9_POMCA|nr:hypothetical protein C0Q70_06864 [Pomacea canaliculata]
MVYILDNSRVSVAIQHGDRLAACCLRGDLVCGELSLGAPLASPGHTKREADDVSVSSEVMMEALFYDLDDLQDQLEQCEEQVRNKLKGNDSDQDVQTRLTRTTRNADEDGTPDNAENVVGDDAIVNEEEDSDNEIPVGESDVEVEVKDGLEKKRKVSKDKRRNKKKKQQQQQNEEETVKETVDFVDEGPYLQNDTQVPETANEDTGNVAGSEETTNGDDTAVDEPEEESPVVDEVVAGSEETINGDDTAVDEPEEESPVVDEVVAGSQETTNGDATFFDELGEAPVVDELVNVDNGEEEPVFGNEPVNNERKEVNEGEGGDNVISEDNSEDVVNDEIGNNVSVEEQQNLNDDEDITEAPAETGNTGRGRWRKCPS